MSRHDRDEVAVSRIALEMLRVGGRYRFPPSMLHRLDIGERADVLAGEIEYYFDAFLYGDRRGAGHHRVSYYREVEVTVPAPMADHYVMALLWLLTIGLTGALGWVFGQWWLAVPFLVGAATHAGIGIAHSPDVVRKVHIGGYIDVDTEAWYVFPESRRYPEELGRPLEYFSHEARFTSDE